MRIDAHGTSYEIADPGGVIGRALATGQPYEAKVCEHIYRQGLSGVAVDVGAHVGNHSLWLAVVCGLAVHAFEADPGARGRLRENARRNGAAVTVHDCALGAGVGTARTIARGRLALAGEGDIDVRPLDSFGLEDVALVKIDVEGMEPDVLLGGENTIRGQRPVVYAEAHDRDAELALAEILGPWGYRHSRTFGATPLLEWLP